MSKEDAHNVFNCLMKDLKFLRKNAPKCVMSVMYVGSQVSEVSSFIRVQRLRLCHQS